MPSAKPLLFEKILEDRIKKVHIKRCTRNNNKILLNELRETLAQKAGSAKQVRDTFLDKILLNELRETLIEKAEKVHQELDTFRDHLYKDDMSFENDLIKLVREARRQGVSWRDMVEQTKKAFAQEFDGGVDQIEELWINGQGEICVKEKSKEDLPPFPKLTEEQVAAVIERGKEQPWESRPQVRMSSFDWIKEHYGEWIPGLLPSHLRKADNTLYNTFKKQEERAGGIPEDLDLPSDAEGRLRQLSSQKERRDLESYREQVKQKVRASRHNVN